MFGKKSSEKSEKNVFLYSHEYRYQNMGATKRAKQFFHKHTNSASKKWLGKNRWKKCEIRFFIFTQISLQNMGGKKRAKQFFRNIRIVRSKNVGKKVRKTFFYIHTNIVTKKWGEQNARNNFSSKTLIVRSKNVGIKIVGKKCEKRFFLFTRIS